MSELDKMFNVAEKAIDAIPDDPPSAADLRRFFDGPWCPKCGWVDDVEQKHWEDGKHFCAKCTHGLQPGLWERLPEAKPDRLRLFRPSSNGPTRWLLNVQDCPTDVAASLCVMGVVRARPKNHRMTFWQEVYDYMDANSATIEEATAIACHRWLDSQEKT